MSKKIVLILFIFVNVANSMDQQNILTNISSDKDLLWALTERLCIADNQAPNNFQFFKGKKELFHNLSLVNKTFCDYYTNENIQQRIIDNFGNQRDLSTLTIAKNLCFPKIGKKIIDLHKKASNKDMEFSEADLAESNAWYLNSIIDENMAFSHYFCLLTSAIWNTEVKKAETIINNPAFSCKTLPLQCVIRTRQNTEDDQKLTNLFNIFKILLTRVSPDHRYSARGYTALMLAAQTNEKEIARLLLEHGANPFLLWITSSSGKNYSHYDMYDHMKRIPNHSGLHNAFTLERRNPQGWLMDMYNEIQKKKGN